MVRVGVGEGRRAGPAGFDGGAETVQLYRFPGRPVNAARRRERPRDTRTPARRAARPIDRYSPAADPFYQPGEAPGPAAAPAGCVVSPDTRRRLGDGGDRVPPGQTRTRKWPVLHAAAVPAVDRDTWRLTVSRPGDGSGGDTQPLSLDWGAYAALPRVRVFADFHCVTRWSRLGTVWEGVSTRTVAELARWDVSSGGYVIAGGADEFAPGKRWSTNLPLADFLAPDALLCDAADGVPLPADHGGPVRLIVPRLYAWKSAKWLVSLTHSPVDRPGYWERLGYADRGDPWLVDRVHPDGERFRDEIGRRGDEAALI